MSEFYVVSGEAAREILEARPERILEAVRKTYLLHEAGQSINPDSYFLRFPQKPDSRVIALPAYLGGDADRVGIKWISSFPGNHERGIARASAVLILNDYATGRPLACLEAAGISAARTGASAALAAEVLTRTCRPQNVGVVGAGVIAQTILKFLVAAGLEIKRAICHDTVDERAEAFAGLAASIAGIGQARTGSLGGGTRPEARRLRDHRGQSLRPNRLDAPPRSGRAQHFTPGPRARDPAAREQHRRRRRALPQGADVAAPGRAALRRPQVHQRYAGRPARRPRRAR